MGSRVWPSAVDASWLLYSPVQHGTVQYSAGQPNSSLQHRSGAYSFRPVSVDSALRFPLSALRPPPSALCPLPSSLFSSCTAPRPAPKPRAHFSKSSLRAARASTTFAGRIFTPKQRLHPLDLPSSRQRRQFDDLRYFSPPSRSNHPDTYTSSTWPPSLPSRASALSRSSLTSSSTPSVRPERPGESERVAEDGTRTSVLVSRPPRTPLRETTLVCRLDLASCTARATHPRSRGDCGGGGCGSGGLQELERAGASLVGPVLHASEPMNQCTAPHRTTRYDTTRHDTPFSLPRKQTSSGTCRAMSVGAFACKTAEEKKNTTPILKPHIHDATVVSSILTISRSRQEVPLHWPGLHPWPYPHRNRHLHQDAPYPRHPPRVPPLRPQVRPLREAPQEPRCTRLPRFPC